MNVVVELKNGTCAFGGRKPTVLHYFVAVLRLSPSSAMELACVLGLVIAALSAVFRPFRDCISYGVLWYLYFSCFQVSTDQLNAYFIGILLRSGRRSCGSSGIRSFWRRAF